MRMTRRSLLAAGMCSLAGAQSSQDDWQGIGRVVAVGDVHGDCDALVAVLKMAGLLDDSQRWTGKNSHLVQIGDLPARGPQTRQAFDLLMRLEPEARDAGGMVHPLIGNHEAGLMYGDLRNVTPEEYSEFKAPGSEAALQKAFEEEQASMRKKVQRPSAADLEDFKKTWFARHPPGFVEHRAAFGPNGKYGSWIRKNLTAIRINDSLFVHGGISPKYARVARSEINATIQRELAEPSRLPPGMATDPLGPLWYRGLVEDEEKPLESHVQAVLQFHKVSRMVIGHTVTRTAILPRFGSRVIDIDLGLSRFYGRPPACLVLEGDSLTVLHNGARIPLPGAKPGELEEYYRAVIAADTKPSPVEKLLQKAEGR